MYNINQFSPQSQIESLRDILVACKPSERDVLNVMIWYCRRYSVMEVSQSKIGKYAGVNRQTTNRAIQRLNDLGLVSKVYRYKKTCIYTIASFFYFDSHLIRHTLSSLLPNLKVLTFAVLLSGFLWSFSTKETLNLGIKGYLYKSYITLCKRRDKRSGMEMNNTGLISPVMDKVPLNLTLWGKIKLSAFPDAIILHVIGQFDRADKKRIRDKFVWFEAQCLQRCNFENIAPNWQWRDNLKKSCNIAPNAPVLSSAPKKYEAPLNTNLLFKTDITQDIPSSLIKPLPQEKPKPQKGNAYKPATHAKSTQGAVDKPVNKLYPAFKYKKYKKLDKEKELIKRVDALVQMERSLKILGFKEGEFKFPDIDYALEGEPGFDYAPEENNSIKEEVGNE